MTTKQQRIILLFCGIFFILNSGCRNTDEKPPTVHTSSSKKIVTTVVVPPLLEKKGKSTVKPRLLYFADMMRRKQYIITEAYQEKVRDTPGLLSYKSFTHHGKAKSIFHHPVSNVQNNITFTNISIEKGSILKFDTGLFTGEQSCSDGVVFKIAVNHNQQHTLLFEHTLKEFDVWKPFIVDLSEYAGKTVSIDLMTELLLHNHCDWATWGTIRLIYPPLSNDYTIKSIGSAERHEAIISRSKTFPKVPFCHKNIVSLI